MDNKIRIIIKKPYEKAEIIDMDNSLDKFKKIIGCRTAEFCIFPQGKDIAMIIDDDGKYMQPHGNFVVPEFQDIIVGPCIFIATDRNGETIGLDDKQTKIITKYLNDFELQQGEHIDSDFEDLLIKATIKFRKNYEDDLC